MAELGGERLPDAPCGCPVRLVKMRLTTHTRPCSDRQAAERLAATIEAERPAECCCAGCIGMGPCDDDLGKSDEDDADDHPADCGCAMCLQERDELFT